MGQTASDDRPGYLHLIDTNVSDSRCDVTPLFGDGAAFAAVAADLERRLAGVHFDIVAGIDALGFILGAALAGVQSGRLRPLAEGVDGWHATALAAEDTRRLN